MSENAAAQPKKPYLVDVPVRVAIWIRPNCQRKQFEVLKQARPSILFLQSDGGRNEKEWAAIRQNREMFDREIDWECTVYRFYEEKNQGLYTMSQKVSGFIWERVDRCIFLEDDQLPSVSFFRYCAEMLEKYKDDTRVSRICGMNHLGISEEVSADYFFSHYGSIWGTASWRRVARMRDTEFRYGQDPYVMRLLRENTKDNVPFYKMAEGYPKDPHYGGHMAGGEFYHAFAVHGHHQLQIIPKVNMISNIGCDEDAAHADSLKLMPRGTRRVFGMKTYEMEFPIKHMDYMIADSEYEKKVMRMGAYSRPDIRFFRSVERGFLLLIHGQLWNRIKKRIKKRKKVES